MAGKTAKTKVTFKHDPETWTFSICQEGFPSFSFAEGYLRELVTALKETPESRGLWESFYVTLEGEYFILDHFKQGSPEVLLRLSKSSAKKLASCIEEKHLAVIDAYY